MGNRSRDDKFKLLLALDDPALYDEIKENLTAFFMIETAENADEAYHKIHHFQPDLAILDYSLRNVNPIELYEGIEFLHPKTKYVLVVSDDNLEVAKRIWLKRAIDYIRKPIDVFHFTDDIRKLTRYVIDQRVIQDLRNRVCELEEELSRLKANHPDQ